VKSDYCEFICWNLCSNFDAMFGYVNLMLNMLLLLLILHTWIVVIRDFVDFHSNWHKLVLLLLIVMNSRLDEVFVELDMLLLLICIMGVHFCEVVVSIGEICVELFLWRTKMNFWYMRLLTELLVLLGELDLV